ncbi:MAG: tRNA 4-thiouridine(8) synthase ThiI, partial [Dehalococcoidia bacterium]|nr:tRNA 4-thiouridine(8) synthase ThiI [Dehalococcoidia bacterium]
MNNPQNSVMIRVHEIALKGKNRPIFFDQLEQNLRQSLRGMAVDRVRKRHMGVEVTLAPKAAWNEVADRIKQVFGVVKFYRYHRVEPSVGNIKEFLENELTELTFNTFRITTNRGNKAFPM